MSRSSEAIDTACECADAVRRSESSALDQVNRALEAVERHDAKLGAFVHLDAEAARREAVEIDRVVEGGGDPGPLAGVPMGIKDHEDCVGMPTRSGSLLYADASPATVDSVHVARLRAAGAVFLGKTALPEFGIGASWSRAHGTTRSPWNPERTPGGSSAGSAAAVAAGFVPIATGADYGGSIRVPAAWSGLVGLKPSRGRVPNTPMQAEMGCAGILARCVRDVARHLDVTAGPDGQDPHALPMATGSLETTIDSLDVTGLRATWSPDLDYAVVDPEVRELCERAARKLVEAAGLVWVDGPVRIPNPQRAWLRIAGFERLGQLQAEGAWPDRADALTPLVRQLLEHAARYRPRHIAEAWDQVAQLRRSVSEVFSRADFLLTPGVACGPHRADEPPPSHVAGVDASTRGGATPFSMFPNLSGHPAVSVPAGLVDGSPVGLQIVGPQHRDDLTLRLARIFELRFPWAPCAPGWGGRSSGREADSSAIA